MEQKFRRGLELTFAPKQRRRILECCGNPLRFQAMPFEQFMDLLVK